jgi:hypothetical protein
MPCRRLLAQAQHLAATVILGDHGRRQSGTGDAFWQFRQATPGDPLRRIDWRRSARGDVPYVRETEWQAAQSVTLWVDGAVDGVFRRGVARAEIGPRAAAGAGAGGAAVCAAVNGSACRAMPCRPGRAARNWTALPAPWPKTAPPIMAPRCPQGWSATVARCSCRIFWATLPRSNRPLRRRRPGCGRRAGAGAGPGRGGFPL